MMISCVVRFICYRGLMTIDVGDALAVPLSDSEDEPTTRTTYRAPDGPSDACTRVSVLRLPTAHGSPFVAYSMPGPRRRLLKPRAACSRCSR